MTNRLSPKTHRISSIALATGFALAAGACGKKEEASAPKTADQAAKAPAKLPAFEGPLTAKHILDAKELVQSFNMWPEALGKLESALGKPTQVDGKKHSWAVADDASCVYLEVEQDNEAAYFKDKPDPKDMVGSVEGPAQVGNDDSRWERCTRAAGIAPPPEDPSAPVPPEDGSAVSVSDLQAGVKGAPSQWLDKTVKVNGVFMGLSTSESNGQKTFVVSVAPEGGGSSVGCKIASDEGIENLAQNAAVEATGKVAKDFGGFLEECTLVAK